MSSAEEIKVLLVDDEPHFVKLLAERLEGRGCNVETAGGGPEAIDKVKGEPYDAIVLDLLMPDMDGLETLKQLKEINPDLQVILLTGHGTIDKGVEAMKLGAMDFVEKPADFKELLEKIKKAKDQRMLLVEKRHEERIKELMKSKSW
jgi:two-component system OmpR family response regulator